MCLHDPSSLSFPLVFFESEYSCLLASVFFDVLFSSWCSVMFCHCINDLSNVLIWCVLLLFVCMCCCVFNLQWFDLIMCLIHLMCCIDLIVCFCLFCLAMFTHLLEVPWLSFILLLHCLYLGCLFLAFFNVLQACYLMLFEVLRLSLDSIVALFMTRMPLIVLIVRHVYCCVRIFVLLWCLLLCIVFDLLWCLICVRIWCDADSRIKLICVFVLCCLTLFNFLHAVVMLFDRLHVLLTFFDFDSYRFILIDQLC